MPKLRPVPVIAMPGMPGMPAPAASRGSAVPSSVTGVCDSSVTLLAVGAAAHDAGTDIGPI